MKSIHNKSTIWFPSRPTVNHHIKVSIWNQFTTGQSGAERYLDCESSHKSINLKSIHNETLMTADTDVTVNHHIKVSIWNQFTTKAIVDENLELLWIIT